MVPAALRRLRTETGASADARGAVAATGLAAGRPAAPRSRCERRDGCTGAVAGAAVGAGAAKVPNGAATCGAGGTEYEGGTVASSAGMAAAIVTGAADWAAARASRAARRDPGAAGVGTAGAASTVCAVTGAALRSERREGYPDGVSPLAATLRRACCMRAAVSEVVTAGSGR